MSSFQRAIIILLLLALPICWAVPLSFAVQTPWMPKPGEPVSVSFSANPSSLKGVIVDQGDPLHLDFLVYQGESDLPIEEKKAQYQKLVRYFLAALAVPDHEQWVNLSPFERDKIVPPSFGRTDMGQDLLAQDYLLKQLSSSLTSPDTDLGRQFWARVYEQVRRHSGGRDIAPEAYCKVWIVPDKAVIYEQGQTVYILQQHLKVMLDSDYLAQSKTALAANPAAPDVSSPVMRDIILPVIEKEVNEGQNFAALRQIYSSMLLAVWYKLALKDSWLGKNYADQGNVRGIDRQAGRNAEIYDQYLAALNRGVYNMVREEPDEVSQDLVPRKYFAGGMVSVGIRLAEDPSSLISVGRPAAARDYAQYAGRLDKVTVNLGRLSAGSRQNDKAMGSVFYQRKLSSIYKRLEGRLFKAAMQAPRGKVVLWKNAQKKLSAYENFFGLMLSRKAEKDPENGVDDEFAAFLKDNIVAVWVFTQMLVGDFKFAIQPLPADASLIKLRDYIDPEWTHAELLNFQYVLSLVDADSIDPEWKMFRPSSDGVSALDRLERFVQGGSVQISKRVVVNVREALKAPRIKEPYYQLTFRAPLLEFYHENHQPFLRDMKRNIDKVLETLAEHRFHPVPGTKVDEDRQTWAAMEAFKKEIQLDFAQINAPDVKGGIDMNEKSLDMYIYRPSVNDGGILSPEVRDAGGIQRMDGLSPEIVHIQPAAPAELFMK